MTWTQPNEKCADEGNIRNRLKAAFIPTNDGTERSNLGEHGVIVSENKVTSCGISLSAQIIAAIELHTKRGGWRLSLNRWINVHKRCSFIVVETVSMS